MPIFEQRVYVALAACFLLIGPVRAAGENPPNQVFGAGEIDKTGGKLPKPLKQAPPVYPAEMARAGLIGAVTVEFIIDTQGRVRDVAVIKSNNPWFERAAVDAVIKWKFQPAEMRGRPVNTRVSQLIEFAMGDMSNRPDLWRAIKGKDHDKLPPEFQWDDPPSPTSTMFPVFPFQQLKTGTAGKAQINYIVGRDGRVVYAKLIETTAPEFGLAVLAMIDAWQFTPAKKKDGTPVFANLSCVYDFQPKGGGDVPVSDEAREILRLLVKKPAAIATLKDLDRPLRPLARRPPVYPTALEKAGLDGEAEIEFFIDKNGDAQLPRIVSCTAREFGYAAVQAVATWRFQVPQRGGKPVAVRAQIPIGFSLPGGKSAEKK